MKNKKEKKEKNRVNILGVYQGLVLYFFSVAVMVPLFLFGVVHYESGSYFIAYVELIFGLVVVLNVFYFRSRKNMQVAGTVIALSTFFVLQAVFITGGLEGTGIFWFFAYPLLVFFLLGRRTAIVWIGIMFVSIIAQYSLDQAGYLNISYSFIELRQALYVFLTVSALTYMYESIIEKRTGLLRAEHDQVTTFAEQLIDINREQEREKAVDEAIMQNMGEGLIATDSDGKILVINQAALRMLGWQQSDVKGARYSDLIHVVERKGGKVPKNKLPIELAIKKRETFHTSRYDYIVANGDRMPVSITASPILVGDRLEGSIVVFRDITNEVNVDRAKSEFISLVSHQLRTPLTALNSYIELFLNGDVGRITKAQEENFDDMHEITQQSIKMVVDLLNVSRLESSMGFQIKPEPTLIETFIEDTIKSEERFVKNHNCKIEFENDLGKVSMMKMDKDLMTHVLKNLISNAVKYSKPDNCSIAVRAYVDRDDVVISVVDHGIGIPKDEQVNVFKRFYRAENARNTEGTGLGLYIAKMIVDISGGRIWFESQEGKGSTFYVSFPKKGMKPNEGEKRIAL